MHLSPSRYVIATFALAVNHYVIIIHNRQRPTYHPQPAFLAVHTTIKHSYPPSLFTECLPDPVSLWHGRLVGGTFSDTDGWHTVAVGCLSSFQYLSRHMQKLTS